MITALMVLSFLSVVGAALLASTRIDVAISDNYAVRTQLQYLAEAGLESAREALRISPNDLATDLAAAAGVDGTLSTGRTLATLLAGDDLPLLPADAGLRVTGQVVNDALGDPVGTYHVFVRNDVADGMAATADTNSVATLLSIARIGDSTKIIEATVRRGSFPPVPAALTLNGNVGLWDAANSNLFQIDGEDQAGSGNDENAIGVISPGDDTIVTDGIPENRQDNYTGAGGEIPDVADVSGELSGVLTTVDGLESIVDAIAGAATDVYSPAFGTSAAIGDIGGAGDYRVVVVHGNATVGPGDGFGVLLVRGVLNFSGNFSWNGLVLAIGQGEIHWNGGGNGSVQGGMFLARTRDTATAGNPLGDLLADRGDVIADFNGGGGNGILYNTDAIANAAGSFPFAPIAVVEH